MEFGLVNDGYFSDRKNSSSQFICDFWQANFFESLNKVVWQYRVIFSNACSSVNTGDDLVSYSGYVSITIVENSLPDYSHIFSKLYHLQEEQLSLWTEVLITTHCLPDWSWQSTLFYSL